MLIQIAAIVLAANTATVNAAKISVDFLRRLNPHTVSRGPKGRPRGHHVVAAVSHGVPGVDSLVNFTGQFTAPGFDSDGNPQSVWPFEMVGLAPERGQTTVIDAPIVPVVLDLLDANGQIATFNGLPLTFDPRGLVQPVLRSPVFQRFPYLAGNTQFADGMMRAQFWDRIHCKGDGQDNGYHVLLDPSVKTTRRMQIPFGSWSFAADANGNIEGALVELNTFGSLLFPATSPVDASTPVGAAELAGDMTTRDLTTLLFNNVFLYDTTVDNCCVLGFHTYDLEPGDARNGNRDRRFVSAFASWLSSGLFAFGFEDITPLSHEISEAFDDPFVDNATPWWLSTDPFFGFNLCQNNLETGDVIEVLSSNPVFPIQMNGRTYHPQNEALFSWFSFTSPSPALNGSYSFPDETTLTTLSPSGLPPGCGLPTP